MAGAPCPPSAEPVVDLGCARRPCTTPSHYCTSSIWAGCPVTAATATSGPPACSPSTRPAGHPPTPAPPCPVHGAAQQVAELREQMERLVHDLRSLKAVNEAMRKVGRLGGLGHGHGHGLGHGHRLGLGHGHGHGHRHGPGRRAPRCTSLSLSCVMLPSHTPRGPPIVAGLPPTWSPAAAPRGGPPPPPPPPPLAPLPLTAQVVEAHQLAGGKRGGVLASLFRTSSS